MKHGETDGSIIQVLTDMGAVEKNILRAFPGPCMIPTLPGQAGHDRMNWSHEIGEKFLKLLMHQGHMHQGHMHRWNISGAVRLSAMILGDTAGHYPDNFPREIGSLPRQWVGPSQDPCVARFCCKYHDTLTFGYTDSPTRMNALYPPTLHALGLRIVLANTSRLLGAQALARRNGENERAEELEPAVRRIGQELQGWLEVRETKEHHRIRSTHLTLTPPVRLAASGLFYDPQDDVFIATTIIPGSGTPS